MSREIFAHVPYPLLAENLTPIIATGINPEIFFDAQTLETLIPEELTAIMETLRQAGRRATIHAPFMDLNPGSFEPLLRDATIHRFRQTMEAARIVRPVSIVMHPGYDRWRYGDRQTEWLERSLPVWEEVDIAAGEIGCRIAIENIFDDEPSVLKALLDAIDSPRFGHCFDIGHWNLFHSVSLEEWFSVLGSSIIHLHIHDNHGTDDDHLPLGEGSIDFDTYFRLLRQYAADPVYAIETHDKNQVLLARQRLEERLQTP
ncbi:MAG: sugar phosphate isomerase/epimerase [Desulfuromonadia bacterium]